jgi:predicted sulfurtransferase
MPLLTVALFYKYVVVEDVETTSAEQKACAQKLGLSGRVRLAKEGKHIKKGRHQRRKDRGMKRRKQGKKEGSEG